MKKQKFKLNKYIIKENLEGDEFYLIIKGKARITVNGNSIPDLDSGYYLVEIVLL